MVIRRFVLRPDDADDARDDAAASQGALRHPARFGHRGDASSSCTTRPACWASPSTWPREGDPRQLAADRLDGGGLVVRRERRAALVIGEHIMFWVSLGAVLAFLPYFPYSKHIHLFFAPINFALKPQAPIDRRAELHQPRRPDHRAVRRGQDERPGLGADHGQLRLHHVLPLPGGLPGLQHRQAAQPGGAGDQQALSPEQRRGRRTCS